MIQQPRLKVLFLASSYPRGRDDTASVFLRYLAEHLADCGLDIHVLAPADGKGGTALDGKIAVHRFQYFFARFQRLAYGSGIMSNLRRSPWLWLQVPFFVLAMAYSALRVIRREKIDLLHAHWILPQGLVGLMAKYLQGVPLITTVHGADAFALRGKLAGGLKRWVIAQSDAWTANTAETSAGVNRGPSAPAALVIPMGVDTRLFSAGRPAVLGQAVRPGEFLMLFVGRLVEKKGCGDLLEALALLPPGLRDRTTLWVVGDGDQRSRLEQTAKVLGVAEQVRFWGTISNRRLPEFYAAADLFVAPSVEAASGDTEGQGVVILEAFAARVCVLATRVGGIDSVVRDHITGVLVPPNRPRDLAAAIEQLLGDQEQRQSLAQRAFMEVKERYDWKRIAGEFARLYRNVAEKSVRDSNRGL
jgi:glycosyltransferase involved in cell wall biosynthesis